MANARLESIATLALLAALKRQDAIASIQLGRLNKDQLRELLTALNSLENIAGDMYERMRRTHA